MDNNYIEFSEQIDKTKSVSIDFNKSLEVCYLFKSNDKKRFLNKFYKLDPPSKHVVLLTIINSLSEDIDHTKKMVLDELIPELRALKVSNRRDGCFHNVDVSNLENKLYKAVNE